MDKRSVIDFVLVSFIIILGIFIGFNIFKGDDVKFINRNDLYDLATKYIEENDLNVYRNKDNYKLFISYDGFGIAEDDKYRYAYMWIIKDSYYIQNGEIKNAGGSSIPYKFIFSKDDKVIKYYNPEDGRGYDASLMKLFPRSIYNKIKKYKVDNSKIDLEVKNYYK